MVIIMTQTINLMVKLSLVLCAMLFSSSYAQAGALDPLEEHEIEKAKQIQLSYVQNNNPELILDASSSASRGTQTPFIPEIEILLVERHAVKKGKERSAQRLADVYSYDYRVNVLNQVVVNLDRNSVVSVIRNSQIQLPLTDNEIQKATDILLADQVNYQLILKEFKQITGEEYTNPSQIEIKAFAFWGNSLPGVATTEALKCGNHRCAQLLLYTPDRVAFEVSPVVDLSLKKVVQNITF